MKKKVQRVMVNGLTGIRVILSIIFLLFMMKQKFTEISLSVVFALICLSDFLDGKLARKFAVSSNGGAVFDIVADSFFVLSATWLCVTLQLVPMWYFLLVLYKLVEFIGTSYFLKRKRREDTRFYPDPIGRIAAALFFLVPYISLLGAIIGALPFFPGLSTGVCGLILSLVVISSYTRLKACFFYHSSRTVRSSVLNE